MFGKIETTGIVIALLSAIALYFVDRRDQKFTQQSVKGKPRLLRDWEPDAFGL